MKYKLINKQTNKETLCDKVTIDGFDYYVSNEKITEKFEGYLIDDEGFVRHGMSCEKSIESFNGKKVIATNNPNLDIPKVVDEVERLKFVYNEGGNKDVFTNGVLTGIEIGYNKSQETHPNSDEDMIEFAKWLEDNMQQREYYPMSSMSYKELLQIWKEQKPKTLYYE